MLRKGESSRRIKMTGEKEKRGRDREKKEKRERERERERERVGVYERGNEWVRVCSMQSRLPECFDK